MSSEEEDFQFEYESDEESEPDVEIENQYYSAKGQKDDEPLEALSGFEIVVSMQEEKCEWGFKALAAMVKLNFQLKKHDAMMEKYKEMLSYIRSAVTRNMSEKKINKILDYISGSEDAALLQEFYMTTLSALKGANNERLWFKTNLKLGGLRFLNGEYSQLKQILAELHAWCTGADGEDDMKKGTQLQEIYALEIQMYTEMKDNVNLKSLYERALRIKSAIPHPRVIGLIRECGGKMHMAEHKWEHAYTDFFEAFKSYDEAGNKRRIACLKYLVLANMLANKDLDPFNAQEAKPYKTDPEVVAMTMLVQAFHNDDIAAFEATLRNNRRTVMDDPFIRNYIEDLLQTIRTQVLLKLVKPYTQISLAYLASERALNIPIEECEALCVALILDGTLQGSIDGVNQLLQLPRAREGADKYSALDTWTKELGALADNIHSKLGNGS